MKVSEVKNKFGKCLELVSMDPNFHNISVGLFMKNNILTVWSYSRKEGIENRLNIIRDKMVDFGGLINSKEDFKYPGPKPLSRETAILMMADSVEAASKSLKNPNEKQLEEFVDKIVSNKMIEDQFDSSDITLKEIETVKKVLFKKLINIYQLRIGYPE